MQMRWMRVPRSRSLERAAVRSRRSEETGRRFASSAPAAAADLDAAPGRARAGLAAAVSALGKRQAGGAAGARGAEGFDFHGRTHPHVPEEAGPVNRALAPGVPSSSSSPAAPLGDAQAA